MKVINLTIDSGAREVAIVSSNTYYDETETYIIDAYANTYSNPNNYVIRLENPIYDVSDIKLISARIPTPQLTICGTNKSFSVDSTVVTLDETNYSNGYVLAQDIENLLAPPTSNVSDVTFDPDINAMIFSNVGDSNAFTLEFYTGTDGYLNENSVLTTPHQIMGFGSNDYTSGSDGRVTSGVLNFNGPNSLVLKLTAGSDEFTQVVYTGTPFYTGHILLNGSDFINFSGADDHVTHQFHTGPQKFIQDIRIEFFYMSHGRLIPYDFRNQEHILKFEITCSTDKLKVSSKLTYTEPEIELRAPEPQISIPEMGNSYEWKQFAYIGIIVLIGILLMIFMRRRKTV